MIEEKSATIHLVQSSRLARKLARYTIFAMFLAVILIAFLPWQQTSRGAGQVVALDPGQRQQSVQARVKGVVVKVTEGLREGSKVKKGDPIIEVRPFAPTKRAQLEAQIAALKNQEAMMLSKAESNQAMVEAYTEAREFTVIAGTEMINSAKAKLASKQKELPGYKAKAWQAEQNYNRQKELEEEGAASTKDLEIRKKDLDVANSDIEALLKEIESLKLEVKAKQAELEEKTRIAQTKIDYAEAMERDALGSASKAQKEIREVDIKLDELKGLTIEAPRDGTIFRMPVFEEGQAIKVGDPLFTIIPDTSELAVELLVRGNDMPLVKEGQEVRLQFEGWPGVQLPGWPSLAIGVFSGTVTVVDRLDNGLGEFRILVTPREGEIPWPSQERFLRQGVRANGWVQMRKVSLGYEIWRQLNGFPVLLPKEEMKKEKLAKPKIPKG